MIIAFSWLAYAQLSRALTGIAGERIIGVSQRLAAAFVDSDDRLRKDGMPLLRDSALARVLRSPGPGTRHAAQHVLDAERARDKHVVGVELWDRRGTRVVRSEVASNGLVALAGDGPVTGLFASDALLGPLIAFGDTVYIEARVPVLGSPTDTLGFVRIVNRLNSDQSGKLIRGLIGSDAILLLGNPDGVLWTDLRSRVGAPPVLGTPGVATATTDPDGKRWIGAMTVVPRLRWKVWVAQPRNSILAPAHQFLLRIGVVALALIVLGTLAASILSAHIVAPLLQVTHAAEGMSRGDYSQRVAIERNDEVGRLAGAFNVMAEEIQSATVNLEQQQVELEMQQAELEASNIELQEALVLATKARDAAERSRVRSEAVLAASLDCVITIDRNGRIVEFNQAAEKTFGHAAGQAIGKSIDELVVLPEHRDAHHRGFSRYVAQDDGSMLGVRLETTGLHSDGSTFPAELAITRVPLDGEPLFTGFLRDLSLNRALEAQLQQSQKMDAVGRLAGGVAHDFNNILTVILSYTELLLSEHDADSSVRADIGHVRSAAQRAASLTRQLLAFSRKQVMHPTVLDVNAVVGEMHAMLGRVIREDVRLETRLGGAIWPVRVDRGQLEQVLMNLAVNARDAMPNGGSLVIETANVELDAAYVDRHPGAMAGSHVALVVTDTGTGMDATTRERAFEPFFTTKGPGKGTGLGLSTVYGIVKQSGGSIWVYSEWGRGTCFKVYFPRYEGELDGVPQVDETPVLAHRDATILLVEDDEAVRAATRRLVERFGYSVVEAPNAEVALALISASEMEFDMVLTDAVMPGMSGLELAEMLAADHPSLPLVLVSGYTEDAINRGGPLAPNAVFLEKPFTVHALSRTIADVLRRSKRAYA